MLLAQRGLPSLRLVLVTLIGGTLAAGSANTINCYLDRDIDAVMKRTSGRPLVNKQGVITPAAALIWGIVLGAGATALLGLAANWLAAGAGRRRDPVLRLRLHAAAQAPFRVQHRDRRRRRLLPGPGRLGGGQGHDRAPGDRAVRGDLPLDPAALLGPGDEVQGRLRPRQRPHAPGGGAPAAVTRKIVIYSYAMVAATLALAPYAGWLYTAAAVALGAWFLLEAHRLHAQVTAAADRPFPMRLFHLSIAYLTLLFAAVAVSALLPIGHW